MKILIVEDDESTAEAIAFHMRAAGLEPSVAADGLAGLRALRGGSPDAVVLDLMLPGGGRRSRTPAPTTCRSPRAS
jgi:DNA-binding response OmpR family regulator